MSHTHTPTRTSTNTNGGIKHNLHRCTHTDKQKKTNKGDADVINTIMHTAGDDLLTAMMECASGASEAFYKRIRF